MKYQEDHLHLEATELRLGLPGSCRSTINDHQPDHKQSPDPSSSSSLCASRGIKRTSSDLDTSDSNSLQSQQHTSPVPPPKAQIVGWPPIRSCRKNIIQVIKNVNITDIGSGVYVKVSMDGAPYLRKIDLNIYKGYKDLLMALGGLFKCNIINNIIDGSAHQQYATTYQDKDGDWMLAGDVPWEMFVSSCKRLRIMRASEAKGLII